MTLASIFAATLGRHRLVSVGSLIGTLSISLGAAAQQTAPNREDRSATTNGEDPNPAAKPTEAMAAPTIEECLTAHRESQSLRKQLRLLESRTLLYQCSHAACPAPVKRDCLHWTDEIAAQLPSIVFRVDGDDSNSSRKVKIYVDDELRFQVVPNRAVDFNPGTYRFRFVTDGKPPIEHEIVLGEAEKFRNVTIKFASDQDQKPSVAPVSQDAAKAGTSLPPTPPATVVSRPTPLASYIFAGLGVAATINFAVWGLSTKSLKSDMENKCAPDCEQSAIDRLRLRAAIADASLGVGVVSFATATIVYLLRPTISTPVEVNVGVLPQGGLAGSIRWNGF
jgi:hypothetical protein